MRMWHFLIGSILVVSRVNDRVAYAQRMRINGGALLERMPTVGGKANPPFASYLTPAE
jgi:hypothetical protein